MSGILLRCDNLVVGHAEGLLPPISLEIRRGQLWSVVGRNGAGKSTWLKTMLGMLPPIAGKVDRIVSRDRLAYVGQRASLDSIVPLEAREIVMWGRLRGWSFARMFPSAADRDAVAAALVQAEASDLAHRRYSELSEGQKQRVLFARMLATDADVVFLDEPTAAMDMVAEREVMERLAGLARERNRAVVIVSHYIGLVRRYADRMLFLDADSQIVIAGEVDAVASEPAFERRYGGVLESHG